MKVQMLVGMSGSRADGSPWPGKGQILEVDDWEGEHLIRGEMARAAPTGSSKQATAPAADPVEVQELVPEQPDGEARPPKPVQPKADWVDWAMAQGGLTEDEANMMTKAQLMEQFGSRA